MDAMNPNLKRGVSLTETLVALLIFLISVTGYLTMQTQMSRATGQSEVISRAVFLAESKLEDLKQLPFDQLITAENPQWYDAAGNVTTEENGFFSVVWTTVDIEATPAQKNTNLVVSWDFDNEMQTSIELNFLRSE